jgi:hypothetical protein
MTHRDTEGHEVHASTLGGVWIVLTIAAALLIVGVAYWSVHA